MTKLLINSRDTLHVLDIDMIAAVQADGNYSRVVYINRTETFIAVGISKLETMLKKHNGKRNRFIRIGRSVIVNHGFLYKIDLNTSQLILTDDGTHKMQVKLSRRLIKAYKDATVQSTLIRQGKAKAPTQISQP